MSNINNLRMGVCTVTYGGVSVGHTKGGVTFKYEPKFEDLMADQYGETPIDKVLTGENVTVEANLAEPQVTTLNIAMPAAANTHGSSSERLAFGTDTGYSSRSDAKALVLHPVDRAATDYSEDITLYKAVASDAVEIKYESDNQRVYAVTFTALVDETYGSGRRLGHIGSTDVS